MAELADALGLGPCIRKDVGVQVPSPAQLVLNNMEQGSFYKQLEELKEGYIARFGTKIGPAVYNYVHCKDSKRDEAGKELAKVLFSNPLVMAYEVILFANSPRERRLVDSRIEDSSSPGS